jgi:hypothetical protein
MKIHPTGAELFYTNDWADRWSYNNDNSHFLQLCQHPKIESSKLASGAVRNKGLLCFYFMLLTT